MDEALLRLLNGWASEPIVATIAVVLSSRWIVVLVMVPLFVVLFRQRRLLSFVVVGAAMGAGDALNSQLIKPFFGRVRPCRALEDLVVVVKCGVGQSLPSGHAVASFVFLFAAAPLVPKGYLIFTPLAVGVALSRVFLGVHYPTDIAAGAVLGTCIGLGANEVRRRLEATVAARARAIEEDRGGTTEDR